MSLENASGGFTDLDELARNKTLVVCRIKEFNAPEKSEQGYESNPVTVDLLFCSGPKTGEVVRGMKMKRNGITNTLRRSAPGKDVAGVVQVKLNEKRKDRDGNPQPFVSLDPVNSEQMDDIKKAYRDGVGFDDNANLVSAAAAAPSAASTSAVADSEPPF